MLKVSQPYREWLGLDWDGEEVPDAYSLLRLETFETNVNRIRTAAEQQRSRMARCKTQADSQQWRQVNGALEEAIATLLEPGRKSELDLSIKRKRVVETKTASAPMGDANTPVTCGSCGQENVAGRRYCAGCGDPLWIECLGCSAICASSEKFCGSCGANLAELADQTQQKTQSVIDRAVSLADRHEYGEAIAELTPLIENTHQHLLRHASQAAELMEKFVQDRKRYEGQADEAKEKAGALVEDAKYSQAIETLESVPERFRDDALRRLLHQAHQKGDEVRRLKQEITESAKQGKASDAMHRIERLLALNPGDARVEEYGKNLAKQMLQAAVKQASKNQYQAGLELLEQIPERYRGRDVERRIEALKELHWLQSTIRHSPYADKVLVEATKRLCEHAPKNEQAARLRQRLDERLKKNAERQNGRIPVPVPWASLPETSTLGVPIEWEVGLKRLRLEDSSALQAWKKHPAQFYVACGLALHGLGESNVSLDLKPRKKTGVLGNLSLGRGRKATAQSAWGLDLGASSLKAVRLVVGEGDQVMIDKAVCLPLVRSAAGSSDGMEPVEALRTLREEQALDAAEPTGVNISSLKLLGRFLRLPRLEGKRFQQVLDYEVRHRIPVPIEDLSWDHHLIPEPGEVYDEVPQSVLLVAAKQFEVERRLAIFEEADISVDSVQTDAMALHNWLQFDQSASDSRDAEADYSRATIILDIGSDASQMVVSWPYSFWFRVVGTGGDDVTRCLVKEFRLTNQQAEQLKRDPTKSRSLSKLFGAVEPIHERLQNQLKQSLDTFLKDYPEIGSNRAIGVGGGFALHGLLRALYPAS